jgi:cell division protein FtsI (penicillin-binding protein 3)
VRLGDPKRRLRFALAVLIAMFGLLAGRLVYLQLTSAAAYAAAAAAQRSAAITLVAPRGAILDRNGTRLAHSVPASAVYADPTFVRQPAETARRLSGLLAVQESKLAKALAHKRDDDGQAIRFTYLARGLDPEVGQAVKALEIPGVYVLDEQRRDVPGHDLAANIVGFTGIDGYGLAGLEAAYDDELKGVDGSREFEVGGSGQPIPDGYQHQVRAKPGRDLHLTIDSDLQFQTQRMLSEALRSARAYSGSAVVMDVQTGELLAMASYPTYDAANPTATDERDRQNLATSSVIEPGSVHKAITFAAGLECGVINKDSVLTVPMTIEKGDKTFRDTHSHPTTGMTLSGILAQSSNVGTIMIADGVGAERLYEFQRAFGLGEGTGLGLPGESDGIVQPPANWSGSSYGGIPIGLGVAVTPLQMTSVYATVANDGVRVAPSLISGVSAPGEGAPAAGAPKGERVMSSENAQVLREALEAVTSSEGTGAKAAVPGYRVAGKTGTGMRVEDGAYAPGDVTSFIGMVPADAPRYVIGVFAHVPSGTGGAVTGPVFSDLASFTLRHYGVAPTGNPAPEVRIYG